MLAGAVWPAKVTTSGRVKRWALPAFGDAGVRIRRDHDLVAMVCRTAPGAGEGRWATPADRGALEGYQQAYNTERHTSVAPDWDALLAHPTVAVLEEAGRVVAVVKSTTATGRYATLGGTWTDPGYRRRGTGRRVTAFLVAALLAQRRAVHLVVDDDNAAALALYRSLGFEAVGSCYMGYLPDMLVGGASEP